MKYSEEDLVKDLKEVNTGNDMNRIQEKCRKSGMQWQDISREAKKLYAETWSRLFPCPDEYRENPQIHYEIPHFGKPKTKDDTTSQ